MPHYTPVGHAGTSAWLVLTSPQLRDQGGCDPATFQVSALTAIPPVSLPLWCVACFGRPSGTFAVSLITFLSLSSSFPP